VAARARDPAPRRGRPQPARRRARSCRLDHHHVEPRPDGRRHLDPGDQPPRSRDHRRQQGRGEAGRRRRRARGPQAHEPVAELRPPRRRRLGRGQLHAGRGPSTIIASSRSPPASSRVHGISTASATAAAPSRRPAAPAPCRRAGRRASRSASSPAPTSPSASSTPMPTPPRRDLDLLVHLGDYYLRISSAANIRRRGEALPGRSSSRPTRRSRSPIIACATPPIAPIPTFSASTPSPRW
jgi:hypothetical protein